MELRCQQTVSAVSHCKRLVSPTGCTRAKVVDDRAGVDSNLGSSVDLTPEGGSKFDPLHASGVGCTRRLDRAIIAICRCQCSRRILRQYTTGGIS